MTDYYQATERELETFGEFVDELAERDPAGYTRRNVGLLARDYFGRRAAGKTVALEVDDLGVIEVAMPAAKPETPPAKPEPPATPSKPEIPQGRQAREVSDAVEAHRREWQDTYGNHQGSTLVSRRDGAEDRQVVDAHLRVKSSDVGALDEQARRELAALPAYGAEGWGKQQAAAIRQRAAQRAAAAMQPTGSRIRERDLAAAVGDREDMTWGMVRGAVKAGKDVGTYGLEVQP